MTRIRSTEMIREGSTGMTKIRRRWGFGRLKSQCSCSFVSRVLVFYMVVWEV
ncbi:MAG: hypothetical protein LKM45_00780 [Wolbachia endosymbiont of Alcedoecus sp.]|nr:hypothetical protein [Wolbachia endosymbiont of Alcedoecus sp.]